ncbi:MAG TPA: FmdB family zinc ribbon protein [Acidimicrobiales bacterium]|nr:FmdB family zinc ribbon protein [Acidimicrobiales bacterium]
MRVLEAREREEVPTYEYVCKDCGEHLEVVQSFNEDALTVCPSCQGALKKVFGNIGIVFKGSGFYKTDSRSGSKTVTSPPADAATKAEASPGSTSESTPKPDTPAAKPAAPASTSGTSSTADTTKSSKSAAAAS